MPEEGGEQTVKNTRAGNAIGGMLDGVGLTWDRAMLCSGLS